MPESHLCGREAPLPFRRVHAGHGPLNPLGVKGVGEGCAASSRIRCLLSELS
jgi:hypothetical protein